MKSFRWFFSYLVVASLGLGLAFAVSLRLMAPARSQEAPPSGELPAEFLKEVENTQVPPPPTGASPAPGQQPPAGASAQQPAPAPGATPSQVPPPPVDENGNPVGDGATAPNGTATTAPPVGEAPPSEFAQMSYDPGALRDPFKAFRAARPLDAGPKAILEPLQRFDVDRLRVVGILWDVRVPRAMVRDPDGGVHTVIKNSKIGRNEGFVAVIREGEVVVVETLYEDGKVLKDTRVMELTK